mmetsp:Transcript_17410/g.37458  ORF Transcript_17410/g.37458 Transcript_17410/m.37458 type:complete len:118 (-) Transcript_17410:218-571(-)|eukprot:5874697-Pleurochrysis_carterae.AAC.1
MLAPQGGFRQSTEPDYGASGRHASYFDTEQLFDLSVDPAERRNLVRMLDEANAAERAAAGDATANATANASSTAAAAAAAAAAHISNVSEAASALRRLREELKRELAASTAACGVEA